MSTIKVSLHFFLRLPFVGNGPGPVTWQHQAGFVVFEKKSSLQPKRTSGLPTSRRICCWFDPDKKVWTNLPDGGRFVGMAGVLGVLRTCIRLGGDSIEACYGLLRYLSKTCLRHDKDFLDTFKYLLDFIQTC